MALNLGSAILFLGIDKTKLDAGMKAAEEGASKSTKSMAAGARKVGIEMAAAGGAIVAALGFAVNKSMEFNRAMAEVNTLGVENLDALKAGILDLSGRFAIDLVDGAKAAYQAISAGVPEGEVLKFLEDSARAAAAGITDLTTAVDLGTGIAAAYGVEFSEVNTIYDAAFAAVLKGKTTFEELSVAIGKVAPIAAQAGVGMDELFATMASVTLVINTAEAVTGLKAALTGILKPGGEATAMAEELGIKFDAAALKSMGWTEFLNMIKEATGGNIEKMAQLFGSMEAVNAIMIVSGSGAGTYAEALALLNSGASLTAEAFDRMVEADPTFAWRQLAKELGRINEQIGASLLPTLKRLVDATRPIIESIGNWVKKNPDLTATIVKVVGAVGLLFVALAPFLILMPGIVSTFTAVSAIMGVMSGVALPAVVTGMAAMTAPMWAIVAGAVAVGLSIVGVTIATAKYTDAVLAKWQIDKQADASMERMLDTLELKGMSLDRATLAGKTHAQQMEMVKAALDTSEAALGKEISALNGVSSALGENTAMTTATSHAQVGLSYAARDAAMSIGEQQQPLASTAQSWDAFSASVWNAVNALGAADMGGGGLPGPPANPFQGPFAEGGVMPRTGLAMVGEKGPEIALLPGGTRVIPNDKSMDMLKAGGSNSVTVNVSVNGNVDDNVMRKIKRELAESVMSGLSQAGAYG